MACSAAARSLRTVTAIGTVVAAGPVGRSFCTDCNRIGGTTGTGPAAGSASLANPSAADNMLCRNCVSANSVSRLKYPPTSVMLRGAGIRDGMTSPSVASRRSSRAWACWISGLLAPRMASVSANNRASPAGSAVDGVVMVWLLS